MWLFHYFNIAGNYDVFKVKCFMHFIEKKKKTLIKTKPSRNVKSHTQFWCENIIIAN